MVDCSSIQKSLAWCQGKPEYPGIKRRIYYISKYDILLWPTLPHDSNGRLTGTTYVGSFTLRSDAKWKYIDIIPDKSQLTSEAQGDYPSQTQLNKLTAVHPAVGSEASAAAAYLNNNDIVFLVEDMKGAIRVVGCDKWLTKTTVSQDLGQGTTGAASTTINVEATDECPAPFYTGDIITDDGTIAAGSFGGSSNTTIYDNVVTINGTNYTVGNSTEDSRNAITLNSALTSMRFTGSNMMYIAYQVSGGTETEIPITNGTVAEWSGSLTGNKTLTIFRTDGTADNPVDVTWLTITISTSTDDGLPPPGTTG